ncbi:MAG: DUF4112 domain-containing protein [Ancylobacter novellus]|uniref:DUF4112 domain-containing protein n=1 Tax=Ancylobacter novellus TaxID=921 RepID=A0A2W5M8T1_ANCNO|nr:MAG: DUF4112 domain-containing protein [Ancylobacter novellus]
MSAASAAGFAGRIEVDDREATLRSLERLADLLDSRWRVPGTGLRFGVDPIVNFVPVAGPLSTALVSAYMIKRASDLGAPGHVLARMVGNVALDSVVGSIPVVGWAFDFANKANRRNMRMLRRHFGHR